MTNVAHGAILPLEPADLTRESSYDCKPPSWPFGYMFPELQLKNENLLRESAVDNLRGMGKVMEDPANTQGVLVPAIYTFLGQFIDHDISREKGSSKVRTLSDPSPIDPDQIPKDIVNSRSPNLDLDHVYGPDVDGELAPRDTQDPNKLLVEKVGPGPLGPIPGKDEYNDLPRRGDGSARIGDQRDDENIVISQLHVAFLRAHNTLVVDHGLPFAAARKLLTQHYQWIVLNDFLDRVLDPVIVKRVRFDGPKFFNPSRRTFFMPLEFSVAAYRFGHSKVREGYNQFNCKQGSGGLDLLFTNSRQRLTDDWVIDWKAFLQPEKRLNLPRPIDTSLTHALLELRPKQLDDEKSVNNLAVRNLLRGYILRMPTGQAVAGAMASEGILPLTREQILSATEHNGPLHNFLKKTDLPERTPLWFYILAEAAFYSRGYHLGPVGSTIVAEVLIGILRNSTHSILAEPDWRPTLGPTPGKFDITDLLKLAGVL
jgi:hypothetical protein